jgi:hypothetical protein
MEVADEIACDDYRTISVEETQAREQVLLTTFEIAQPKTIPNDGSEHKVSFEIKINVLCPTHLPTI